MYLEHFSLRYRPFSVQPELGTSFFSGAGFQATAAVVSYGISRHQGFVIVLGEPGTGKTTLLRHVASSLPGECEVAIVSDPLPGFGPILGRILLAFGLEARGMEPLAMIDQFHLLVSELASAGKRPLIFIDEAQALMPEQLEQLRMLSNVGNAVVPQIILAGHSALRDNLRTPDMMRLAQRVIAECEIRPLGRDETQEYIRFRLSLAGDGSHTIFDDEAGARVFECSRGVPRLINILCDDALSYACLMGRESVDADLISGLARERQRGGLLPLGSIGSPVPVGSEAHTAHLAMAS